MRNLCEDLHAECEALVDFSGVLQAPDWAAATSFHAWTPWDEIAHLCLLDEVGHLAATDATAFSAKAAELRGRREAGDEISAIARSTFAHLTGPQLVAHWREVNRLLASALSVLDPKARLPWFGPSMSARSFATARLMEVWAHGQDVYDLMKVRRANSARLKHIAHLGVTTFEWTFKSRGLPVPASHSQRDWTQAYSASAQVEQAWLQVYRAPDAHWDLYQLGEELTDLEDAFRLWRFRHVTTVERVIGFKRGTGGTGGVSYLRKMLDVVLFPEIWKLRTDL